MRKYLTLLVGLLFILTACGGISQEKAAEVFVNRLIYQKDAGEFANSFRYGRVAGEELDENQEKFEENFIQNLKATGVEITEEQAESLTSNLIKQMREKTSYNIIKIDKQKEGITVTYFVTGLDLVSTMQEIARELIKEAEKNPEVTEDEQKILDTTIGILEEKIQNIKIKSEPIKMKLQLEKTKGKWEVTEKNQDQITNLFMAFLSGEKDQATMSSEIDEALNQVIREFLDANNNQPISKNKKKY